MTIRRLKTFNAETGLVYEYYFVGKRPALPGDPEEPATEFVFDVRSGQQPFFAVSIFLRETAIDGWQCDNGRALTETEIYAAAKMMLLNDLDSSPPCSSHRRVSATTGELGKILALVGVD